MKTAWIFKSLAGGLALYAAAGFMGVPYIIKNIVPDKVAEATNGGKLSVGSAFFNPFSFRLTLGELTFKTPAERELFAMKRFSLNADPFDYLARGEWLVKDISLVEPHITVHRY